MRYIIRIYNLILGLLLILIFQITVMAEGDPNQVSEKVADVNETVTVRKILKENKRHDVRIAKITELLKKESLEKSIKLLSESNLYFWNNYQIILPEPEINIPLKASADQINVIAIMGNRRFLKVMDEIKLLPKTEAANLLNKEIINSLEEYEKLFNSYMAEKERIFKHNLEQPNKSWGLSFVISTNDDSPSLISQRHKVWALVLIAGNLELPETKDTVSKVVETAMKQREMLYNKKGSVDPLSAGALLGSASLYNRQILATAALGTYVSSDKAQQILNETVQTLETHRLTHYSSSKALYDLDVGSVEIADYSKGELSVKCLKPLDDSKFDAIIEAVK